MNDKLEKLKTQVNSIFNKTKNKLEIFETNSAIMGQYTIHGIEEVDAASFLAASRPQVVSLLAGKRQTKVNLVRTCTMERVDIKTGEVTTDEPHFRSMNEVILESTDLNDIFDSAKDKVLEAMASYQMRESNWRFRQVVNLEINTAVYKPFKGNSYIPLPKFFAVRRLL